jgi:hypothetical protein
LLVVGLNGCVSGNAVEQREVETQEATRGAVLEEIQATSNAERFKPATPEPAPSWTPKAALADLVLASSVNSDNSPNGDTSFVSNGSTIYACARVSSVRSGQKVIAVWTTVDGGEISRGEQDIGNGASERWVALRWQPSGIAGGTYAVKIYIDRVDPEHLLDSLVFRVG